MPNIVQQVGFENFTSKDIKEVLVSQMEELTNEELQELVRILEEDYYEGLPERTLTIKSISAAVCIIDIVSSILAEEIPYQVQN